MAKSLEFFRAVNIGNWDAAAAIADSEEYFDMANFETKEGTINIAEILYELAPNDISPDEDASHKLAIFRIALAKIENINEAFGEYAPTMANQRKYRALKILLEDRSFDVNTQNEACSTILSGIAEQFGVYEDLDRDFFKTFVDRSTHYKVTEFADHDPSQLLSMSSEKIKTNFKSRRILLRKNAISVSEDDSDQMTISPIFSSGGRHAGVMSKYGCGEEAGEAKQDEGASETKDDDDPTSAPRIASFETSSAEGPTKKPNCLKRPGLTHETSFSINSLSLSFPRRRESRKVSKKIDSRLRGNDKK